VVEEPPDRVPRVLEPAALHTRAGVERDGEAERNRIAGELRDRLWAFVFRQRKRVFTQSLHQTSVGVDDGHGEGDEVSAGTKRGRLDCDQRGEESRGQSRHDEGLGLSAAYPRRARTAHLRQPSTVTRTL